MTHWIRKETYQILNEADLARKLTLQSQLEYDMLEKQYTRSKYQGRDMLKTMIGIQNTFMLCCLQEEEKFNIEAESQV